MSNLLKPASHTKILLVDDMPDNLRLLARMLESQGYIVRKSLSGKMALQAADRDPPDLILLDINMPEMSGYEVCQQLQQSEATRHIPVIFISALDQIDDKIQSFELGAKDYITKPFQELEVMARIKNQLLIQQQQQQLMAQNQQLEQEMQERQRAEAEIWRLNVDLERRVHIQTLELRQALSFEATLKRISDRVRDSLDQHQILQSAIDELATAFEVHRCDAVLYGFDRKTATARYQHQLSDSADLTDMQAELPNLAEVPEIYNQLQQQQYCFAFCPVQPAPTHLHAAVLACPIFDDRVDETGILGDLWLYKETFSSFSEMEIHLVQQVANQCAIALRQARLYEAAQTQVRELQRLNQLKDDFLSTISHELRTPIANMKMVIQLLNALAEEQPISNCFSSSQLPQGRQIPQYLGVLQDECDRELRLIEDLLNLQHLEAGTHLQHPIPIDLQDWILHIMEPFELRAQNQHQTLKVHLAPALPTLNLDPFCLGRILTELLGNACKYTPAGETIEVSVNLADSNQAALPNLHSSDHVPSLQIQVSNSGVNIPAEELPRIFDKFYRIPNNDPWQHGGTGLGLALVKKLVEQINGAIQVESNHNCTCFTVQLPISL